MVKNGIYGYYDTKENQMVYIGQSKNISLRHSHHRNPQYYNKQPINRILQNNKDRYKLIIIKVRPYFSKEDRDILEKHYIQFYNTFLDDNKFNYTPGGDFAPSTVPEIARKISKSMSGQNNPNYGKRFTKETTEKMRKAKIGSKNPMYGKNHTEEVKRKMSLSQGNSTGYRRVSLITCSDCKHRKRYQYWYYNDDGKKKSISSVNLEKLKNKVLEKGLPWEKIN